MIKLAITITFIATLISGCSSEPPIGVELNLALRITRQWAMH
jgi:PBP1b-binding outer membrane lipoprotein LpoB